MYRNGKNSIALFTKVEAHYRLAQVRPVGLGDADLALESRVGRSVGADLRGKRDLKLKVAAMGMRQARYVLG